MSARDEASPARVRPGGAAARARRVRLAASACAVAGGVLAVGLAFSGSSNRIAHGVEIAGVDVGGLTRGQAVALLEGRAGRLRNTPVVFTAGSKRFSLRPYQLGVKVDWAAAVHQALDRGNGLPIVRGFRRIGLRISPASIDPPARSYAAAVDYEVGVLASEIDRAHRDAKLVRRGLLIEAAGGRPGVRLDRTLAGQTIVDALAGFSRAPVALPVSVDPPKVTLHDLARARAQARRVVSGPVTLARGSAALEIPAAQLARMLELPQGGSRSIALGGPAAIAYFKRLDRRLARPARDAGFAVDGAHVTVVPGRTGVAVDVARTTASVLAAATRRAHRAARISEAIVQPSRTTAEAKAMGITGLVSGYETFFGGIPNRIHNVELVSHLVDGKLIAPGATFSFNGTTGARTAEKGFLSAPVIINGELQTGLGGGVCQVSTTVFNAAYEAGLPITARTNHALYISHYPLGRDATVDYPDVDLRFVNDTPHWLLLRTFVTSSSLAVNLYGTPQHRRVETETAPLRVVGRAPEHETVDKSLKPGERVVDAAGVPPEATSVRRLVYSASGKLLYDNTWYSNYVAEPEIVRVGPKKPKPKPKPAKPVNPTAARQLGLH